jgi:hypothetical protein
MTSCLTTEKQAMNGMLPHQSGKGKCHIVFIQETSRKRVCLQWYSFGFVKRMRISK